MPHLGTAFRRPAITVVSALLVLAGAGTASAGTIGFKIDTTVTTGPGVRVALRITHAGDESARDVTPKVMLLGREVGGEKIEILAPGRSHEWEILLQEDNLNAGAYVLLTRVSYADANAYPFEVVTTSPFQVSATPRAPVRGRLRIPPISGNDTVDAHLSLTIPQGRGDSFDVEFVFPSGLRASERNMSVEVSDKQTVEIPLKLTNEALLQGTSVDAFALVTGRGEAFPQTDLVRGMVRIGKKADPLTTDLLIRTAVVLAALLVVLELVSRWRTTK